MTNARDVAAALIEATGGQVGATKIQKLLYYAQGWSLAWTNTPLFEEELRAWPLGPVVREVWSSYNERQGASIGDPTQLSADETAIVVAVAQGYGHLNAATLKRMTHAEAPWLETRGDLSPDASTNRAIPKQLIRTFFKTNQFGQTGASPPLDERLIDQAIDQEPGALADLIEQGTGARPGT